MPICESQSDFEVPLANGYKILRLNGKIPVTVELIEDTSPKSPDNKKKETATLIESKQSPTIVTIEPKHVEGDCKDCYSKCIIF